MKPIGKEARITNVTGSAFCRWCGGDGYVHVSSRPFKSAWNMTREKPNSGGSMPYEGASYAEHAPCPFCEAGFREEFPVPKSTNKHPTKPPWGEDGYWKGREPVDLKPMYSEPHPSLLELTPGEMRESLPESLTRDFPE